MPYKCIDIYKNRGPKYYNSYRPKEMMFQTNIVFNFVEENMYYFQKEVEFVQLKQAYDMFKQFCSDTTSSTMVMPRQTFREELKAYFDNYAEQKKVGLDKVVRSVYWGF